MQKKHLHGILLVLLVVGCGGREYSANNPYLADQKVIGITFGDASSAPDLFLGQVVVRVSDPAIYSAQFVFQVFPYTNGEWVGGLEVPGFDREASRVSRSLTSLMIEDTVASLRLAAVPLPNGVGISVYLEGEIFSPVALNLSRTPQDTLFVLRMKDQDGDVYLLEDSVYCAIEVHPGFEETQANVQYGQDYHRKLKAGKRRQIVLAFDENAGTASKLAKSCRGLVREELELAVMDSLNAALAFSLNTEDERTDSAFAFLAAALVQAQRPVDFNNRAEIEGAAALAPALFLASRERPQITWPDDPVKNLSNRVRWGLEAYRAALRYGIGNDDSLKLISLDVLSDAARLQREYSENLFVLNDAGMEDSLLQLAVAHVRYADLLSLCGDIALARGDREAEKIYRRDATRAGREARRYFGASGSMFLSTPVEMPRAKLRNFFSEEEEPVGEDEMAITLLDTLRPPDTLRYMQAGAHYGFSWLAEKPFAIAPDELDGLTWQRWVAHRFANDYKITETPDLDSLLLLVLAGPQPGVLTSDPGHDGEPSLIVMGAAFQNLAELYLGFHPNWSEHKVSFEPRPPQKWGRTAAHIPFGTGVIQLDYDFGNNRAMIAIDGIEKAVDVFFGYPLPTGSFVRTQFALTPEQPRARIRAERDIENRVKLEVKTED